MDRTCIICGMSAGSGEHVFPAALGGRRENRGIYCEKHNNAFSPLVKVLSEQLESFNALLGVVPDRKKAPKSASAIDLLSGHDIEYSADKVLFTRNRIVNDELMPGGDRVLQVQAKDMASAQAWIKKNKELGNIISIEEQPKVGITLLGQSHFTTCIGGDEWLRAIAYIAQTFFAQYFPQLIRTEAFGVLKAYTLHGVNEGACPTWWDYSAVSAMGPNTFKFGHRVVVGVHPQTYVAFAKVSLYETFHLNVELGCVRSDGDIPSRAIVVDIDPLARFAKHDIHQYECDASSVAPERCGDPLVEHGAVGNRNRLIEAINNFLTQLTEHHLDVQAEAFHGKLMAASVSASNLDACLLDIRPALMQRVFNYLRYICRDLAPELPAPAAANLEELIKADPKSPSGVTKAAYDAVEIGTDELIKVIREYLSQGLLTKEKVRELLGCGLGMSIVTRIIAVTYLGVSEGDLE